MDIPTRKPYPSDLTDEQWAILAPLLPPEVPAGRPRTTDFRAVLDANSYLLSTGCGWSASIWSKRRLKSPPAVICLGVNATLR